MLRNVYCVDSKKDGKFLVLIPSYRSMLRNKEKAEEEAVAQRVLIPSYRSMLRNNC